MCEWRDDLAMASGMTCDAHTPAAVAAPGTGNADLVSQVRLP